MFYYTINKSKTEFLNLIREHIEYCDYWKSLGQKRGLYFYNNNSKDSLYVYFRPNMRSIETGALNLKASIESKKEGVRIEYEFINNPVSKLLTMEISVMFFLFLLSIEFTISMAVSAFIGCGALYFFFSQFSKNGASIVNRESNQRLKHEFECILDDIQSIRPGQNI